jgi:hypothetical protein
MDGAAKLQPSTARRTLRWMELLSFNQAQQEEGDHDLLKAMELVEEDKELQNQVEEDCELSKEVVAAIAAAREVDPKLTGFDKKRKTKEEKNRGQFWWTDKEGKKMMVQVCCRRPWS